MPLCADGEVDYVELSKMTNPTPNPNPNPDGEVDYVELSKMTNPTPNPNPNPNPDGEVDYVELSKMILCDDIMELLALVPDKSLKSKSKEAESQVIGFRKVTAKELQQAQQAIKTKLLTKYPNITTALRKIDTKGDGYLSREEVKEMLRFNELLKRIDYYTGALHGSITEACADTLCDYVDKDRDGKLNYNEFARVLTADNILMIPAPKNPAARFGSGKFS